MENTLNLNNSDCILLIQKMMSYEIYNLCTGSMQAIPLGGPEIALKMIATALVVVSPLPLIWVFVTAWRLA